MSSCRSISNWNRPYCNITAIVILFLCTVFTLSVASRAHTHFRSSVLSSHFVQWEPYSSAFVFEFFSLVLFNAWPCFGYRLTSVSGEIAVRSISCAQIGSSAKNLLLNWIDQKKEEQKIYVKFTQSRAIEPHRNHTFDSIWLMTFNEIRWRACKRCAHVCVRVCVSTGNNSMAVLRVWEKSLACDNKRTETTSACAVYSYFPFVALSCTLYVGFRFEREFETFIQIQCMKIYAMNGEQINQKCSFIYWTIVFCNLDAGRFDGNGDRRNSAHTNTTSTID